MKKAYICIGGPLDGQHATNDDFAQERVSVDYRSNYAPVSGNAPLPTIHYPAGRFAMHKHFYTHYNSGQRGSPTSMVWIYNGLLVKPIPVGR